MTKTSLKALLGGTAVAIVGVIAMAPGAQAGPCWWAGGDWNCTAPPPYGAVIAPAPPVYVPYEAPGGFPSGNSSAHTGPRYPGPKSN